MAHEIETHDNVTTHKTQAWHGLATVIQEDMTPTEGMKINRMDWVNEPRPMFTLDKNGEYTEVPTHVANYRSDVDNLLLGVVTKGYQAIQNEEVAQFCEALLGESEGSVICESVGSIRNGKRIWFLLKGEAFQVANNDEIFPYICVSNGHDGTAAFRVTPTTVRVVCSNTLHAVIPSSESGSLGNAAISIRHTVNIMDRIVEAQNALKNYHRALEETKNVMNILSTKDVTREEVQQFFMESYTIDFGDIPKNPQSKIEENQRERAVSAYGSFSRRFDDDKEIAGTSMWNAFNAYSGLVQHDKKSRGKDDANRIEKRVDSNLFGLNATRTSNALQRAFSMVG